ncbi:MAG: B12-binding domain-containing radical SAM protein [bacterium]|nr:B12-binding domain-containing radical SAM protein [bacterium]
MKKENVSIKLVQLPIPGIRQHYKDSNIPLAAGYIKAHALANGEVKDDEIRIINRNKATNGGDPAIIDWILQEDTDVVGFTSYMWNIERIRLLAGKIKEINPDITIIFGGPEINDRHEALKDNNSDVFIIGEGEHAFFDFIRDYKRGSLSGRIYRGAGPVNLAEAHNPYLENVLEPHKGESLFIETMRGCPYPCKYCFYSKSYSRLRFFPEEQLPGLFQLARDSDVSEIYMMDPSFNVVPQLEERLKQLQTFNTTGIPMHTEIRLESVTPTIAAAMKRAGFRWVEAGLQSTNPRSLEAIGRDWDKKKFIKGAQLLQEQGIMVQIGIIFGLPFDTIEDFRRTVDFALDLSQKKSMEIYPLSLIPGTQLRDEAEEMGISYMPHPPYFATRTGSMKESDFRLAVELIEEKLGVKFYPPLIPCFGNYLPEYVHFLDLRKNTASQLEQLYGEPDKIGHSLSVLFDEAVGIDQLSALGKWLAGVSPSTLVQLVLDWPVIPHRELIERLAAVFDRPEGYFDRLHHFKKDRQNRYSLRFFHLTGDVKTAGTYHRQPLFCDLILRYHPDLLTKGRELLEEKPVLLVDSSISEKEDHQLKMIYGRFKSSLIFQK